MKLDYTTDSLALGSLGSRLRELRVEKAMTLAEISLLSQVSVAMLSHIERGQASPSLKTLERIRIALDVPLASLFGRGEARSSRDDLVVRGNYRSRLKFQKLGLIKELLSPAGNSSLEVVMLLIDPGGGSGPEPWSRSGVKAGLVLEGRFELTIGVRTCVLEVGDSFQFDSSQPHRFRNLATTQARVIWIISSDAPA